MVYIDTPTYRSVRGKWVLTAHLISDFSLFELHSFARKLQLHPRQFHNKPFFPHYDLFGESIFQAIDEGAISISSRTLMKILKNIYLVF